MLNKVSNAKEILTYVIGTDRITYDEEAETLEEVKLISGFIQNIRELLDFNDLLDESCDRIMTAFNLTENIKELDRASYWIFVGKEGKMITGGIKEPEISTILCMLLEKIVAKL